MPVLEILVVQALVLLNGYFAMSELAVVSARLQARGRIDRCSCASAGREGNSARKTVWRP